MKSRNILFGALLGFFSLSGISQAQNPTYTLDVTNLWITSIPESCCDSMEFDIDMTWTNPGSVPNFEYAGGQYFFDFNKDCIKSGTTWSMSVVDGDLPVNMRPRSPVVYTTSTPGQLRLAVNTFPGAGSGYQMPPNTPVTIARLRIKVNGGDNFFAPRLLQLAFRNGPTNPFTKIFAYVGTTNTDITTSATHTISIPNDPLGGAVAAYFSATPTTLSQGQYVSFTDQTFGSNPTAWQWSFPGGTPSSSTERNPVIRYMTPGVYNVALTASGSGYSNWTQRYSYIRVLNAPCPQTWSHTVKIRDAGTGTDSLRFGMSPSGTNGLDTCLGEVLIPPPPPTGIFDCRFILPSNDAVKTDFRKDTALNTTWRMTFQTSASGYPVTFTWNNQTMPSTGTFFLRDEITGTIVNINMRNQTSYTLTNSGITSLKIEYLYNQTLSGSVSPGWNIVSVPLRTTDMLYTALFPGVASEAYTYSGGYVSISMLSNGTGYWMRFNNNANYNFTGYPWSPENMQVSTGWNLIGPFDENIPVSAVMSSPPGIINSNYFGYSGGYFNPDTLKVGKGYWIRTTASGYLYKVSSDNIARSSSENPLDNFVRLELANAEEGSAVLYLAKPELLTEDYSMPPVPPQGIFDARFATDRYAEDISLSNTVMLSSTSGDTRMTLFNANGMSFRIRDAVNGSIFEKELTEESAVVIPQSLGSVVVETQATLPLTYELSQNYPNPFNPATVIRYQIPEDGMVRITVFDVLGKEALIPLNSFRKAGSYELLLNAGSLPSGVYFYRMDAGTFSEIRKMILLK
ncbi:MAG: T9SS type A sorting domain-containing protein [Ignavibacteria bacterium]|nr:T9SS type A sorting domain-containing protein [Ignavibacteria bacterium]